MKVYTACKTYKTEESAQRIINIFNDNFIIRKRRLASGKIKLYFYEPGFTKLRQVKVNKEQDTLF